MRYGSSYLNLPQNDSLPRGGGPGWGQGYKFQKTYAFAWFGKRSKVEVRKGIFSGTRYEFSIDYQGRQGHFSIDKETFKRYTHGDTFTPGTPIEILYLEKDPGTAEVKEMVGKWFYGWFGGPGGHIILSLFPLILGLLWLWHELFGKKRGDDD